MHFLFTLRYAASAAALAVTGIALALTAPTAAQAVPTADLTYYSDLDSFNAATTTTLYDFEGISTWQTVNPDILTVAASNRVTFSVSGGYDAVIASSKNFSTNINGTDAVWAGNSSGSSLATTTISLDNLYTAFAIELGQSTSSVTNNYTIGLYNDDTQVGTDLITGVNTGYFYGVSSTAGFNNVRVLASEGNSRFTVFDNARTGSVAVTGSAVPEAGTAALILPALGMIGAVVLRRKK